MSNDILENAKRLARDSGLTYQEIGERMGYPKESARQSAWQFLHGANPSAAKIRRFAKAMGVETSELL